MRWGTACTLQRGAVLHLLSSMLSVHPSLADEEEEQEGAQREDRVVVAAAFCVTMICLLLTVFASVFQTGLYFVSLQLCTSLQPVFMCIYIYMFMCVYIYISIKTCYDR